MHEKVAALNVMHYILSHDYRVKILVILSKITIFFKEYTCILKICQQSSLGMPKLSYSEFSRIMRYDYVYTPTAAKVY